MKNSKRKLAIITSHPIQYNAPLFQLLTMREKTGLKVFYTWGSTGSGSIYDPGFGKKISWDLPLLEGYDYEYLENTATDKGTHHFKGIINPHIIRQIDQYQPDAILVYGWSFKSHLKVMRHYKGKVPVYFRGDSTLLDDSGGIKKWIRRLLLWWVYRHIDLAFYAGKSNYDYYKACGIKDKQLIHAPHAIDNKRFACQDIACQSSSMQFRQQLGINPDAFVFLFAGKLEPKKDPALLISSFIESGLYSGAHLVMVGSGVLKERMAAQAAAIPNIHWVDFQNQSQMPAVYGACDVFVLPSAGPGETWGLAINEAMAAGKPVIVSDRSGAAADLVMQGQNGFVFEAGNKKALIEYMRRCLDHRHDIPHMGKASAEKIMHYTFEHIADAVESSLGKLKTQKA